MAWPTRSIIAIGLLAIGLVGPASASRREAVFDGIEPAGFLKKWSFDDWQVWAMPNGSCLALEQYPDEEPFRFWGVRQSPGSRLTVYFGSIANARPQVLQMSFNSGGRFDYDASVERFRDWDAYAISLQSNALSVFPRQLMIEAYSGGSRVFLNVYNAMDRLRSNMGQCLSWQQAR